MPNCDCNKRCTCIIKAGPNVDVTGTGAPSNPYYISAEAGGEGGDTPTGAIVMYGGAAAPAGWLICDGSAVSRAVFSDLFTIMGVAYGTGDGTTTFNLPDLAGRFPLGVDGNPGHARGNIGGSFSVVLTTAMLPAHTHTMAHVHSIEHNHGEFDSASSGTHDHETYSSNDDTGVTGDVFRRAGATGAVGTNGLVNLAGSHQHSINIPNYTGNSGASSTPNTGSVGSGVAVPTTPPYTAVNFIVKT